MRGWLKEIIFNKPAGLVEVAVPSFAVLHPWVAVADLEDLAVRLAQSWVHQVEVHPEDHWKVAEVHYVVLPVEVHLEVLHEEVHQEEQDHLECWEHLPVR